MARGFLDPERYQAQAEALSTHLVDSGLAACINILPQMVSVYRWRDETRVDREQLLVIKTTRRRYRELEAAIVGRHPYEVPEILALPIAEGLGDYTRWIGETCG